MIFTWLARFALRYPRRILLGAALFVVAAGLFGVPASTSLPAGGYDVPGSESARAEHILEDKFDAGGMSIVFAITGPADVDSAVVRARAEAVIKALNASGDARQVTSYWTAPPAVARSLVTADRRTALVVGKIAGSDSDAPPLAHKIAASVLGTRDGVTVSAGGQSIAYYEFNRQAKADLVKTEMIAIPITFVVLIWVFGSAVAAFLPIAIAVCAIAGTAAALRCLFVVTDVSVFALNLATALSLALAIDYTLFIISRYREELSAGSPREEALVRAMNTAGRTVAYSALTIGLAVATMAVFPMYFLRSLAYAGLLCVGLCLLGALVVAPALLVLLGDRLDAFDIRKPLRRLFGRTAPRPRTVEESFFYRTARFSMKRAVPVTLMVTALFVLLAVPMLSVKLRYPDDRMLPTSTPTRQVGDLVREQFPPNVMGSVRIVLTDGGGAPGAVERYAERLSQVSDVVAIAAPTGTFAGGRQVSTEAYGAASVDGAAYLSVFSTRDPFSASGQDQLAALKHVPAPAPVLFGGTAQQNLDNVHGISSKAPLALLLVAVATLVLMFLLTGSVLLPIKAFVMNMLSLTAAFAVMVWVFQDGHLAGFGTTAVGHLNFAIPASGVLHRVRVVNGLRGFRALPDTRGVGEVSMRHHRQRSCSSGWAGPQWTHRHRSRHSHGDCLHRHQRLRTLRDAAAGRRPHRHGACRRVPHPHHPCSRGHEAYGPRQLVGPSATGALACQVGTKRRRRLTGSSTTTDSGGRSRRRSRHWLLHRRRVQIGSLMTNESPAEHNGAGQGA